MLSQNVEFLKSSDTQTQWTNEGGSLAQFLIRAGLFRTEASAKKILFILTLLFFAAALYTFFSSWNGVQIVRGKGLTPEEIEVYKKIQPF